MSYRLLRSIAVSTIFCSLAVTTGCATIVSGSDQAVQVDSVPVNAVVKLDNVNVGNTPARFDLSRKNSTAVVQLELPGYEIKEITLKRGTNGWVWGNILVGGLIGVIVDVSTGAMYTHKIVDDGSVSEVPASGKEKPEGTDIWINVVLQPQPGLTKIDQLIPAA